MRVQLRSVNKDAQRALKFQDKIFNGEIINAVFCLLGFTSSSKLTKTEIYDRAQAKYPLVFEWAKRKDPTLTESEFQQMLKFIEPCDENPWIRSIEQAPQEITIAEARASATTLGKDGDLLLRWLDLLSTDEKYANELLEEIALMKQIRLR